MKGCILFLVILCAGCRNHTPDEFPYEMTSQAFVRSSEIFKNQSENDVRDLVDKMEDVSTRKEASFWLAKAHKCVDITYPVMEHIDKLRKKLESEEDVNSGVVSNLFAGEKQADELFNKLLEVRNKMLQLDPRITEEIKNSVLAIPGYSHKEFSKTWFINKTVKQAILSLDYIKNGIALITLTAIRLCNNMVAGDHHRYTQFNAIVTQSHGVVKAGESIEIRAGIGGFSKAAAPEIKINNKEVALNTAGVAHYKVNANTRPGNYKIPVIIRFTDENGEKQTITKYAAYEVVNCN